MNLRNYEGIKLGLRTLADNIEAEKRPAYTIGSEDVLANFKRVAERSNVSPLQCINVYFLKHVDSLSALCSDPDIPQSEEMLGRFADAYNYLQLLLALYIEEGGHQALCEELNVAIQQSTKNDRLERNNDDDTDIEPED